MKFSHRIFTHVYKIISSVRYSLFVACLFSVGISNTANAALIGPVEDSPLFLTNRAEPNIFFMVDDSGSMDLEMMTPESVFAWGGAMMLDPAAAGNNSDGIYLYLFGEDGDTSPGDYSWSDPVRNQRTNGYILPTQAYIDATYTGVQTPEQQGVWRGRNSDYNQLYYDPTKPYKPWVGLNDAGNPYPDYTDTSSALPASVPIDPYYTAGDSYDLLTDKDFVSGTIADRGTGTATITLTPAAYQVWDDTNSDGIVDPTDGHNLITIVGNSQCTGTDTPFANGCLVNTYDEEIRNFTNWFVYHRKRDYVGKYAISQVINSAGSVRMGMATINNNQQDSNIRLQSMLPTLLPTDDPDSNKATFAGSPKATLLEGLFQMDSPGSTPLRAALQRAGNYYACSGNRPDFSNIVPGPASDPDCGIDKEVIPPATESAGLCQQNFTVLITDGERNRPILTAVGNVDGTSFPFAGFDFTGYDPYADTVPDSLADVAMYYYAQDLDTGLANQVPTTCAIDENPAQHMVTYAVGFGVSGNIDTTLSPPTVGARPFHPKTTAACSLPPETGTAFTWHDGSIDPGPERIDDLVHAAYNGRGDYLSATNADGLTTALDNAMRSISRRTGSASAVALNSSTLSNGSIAYFARFSAANWQGEFSAYNIVDNAIDFSSPIWEAHDELANTDAVDRTIVTFNRITATPSPPTHGYGGMPFRNFNTLPDRHKDDLKTTPADVVEASPAGDAAAQARLDYIRGDHGCEENSLIGTCSTGKNFRDRIDPSSPLGFKLGDIIHSSTVFVGAPTALIPGTDPFGVDGKRYYDFQNGEPTASTHFAPGATAKTRTEMLYVGANDGMLHAFNAGTGPNAGVEEWAYIPGALFQKEDGTLDFGPGLHTLTEPDYEHRYYVDLTPKVADAYIDIDGAGPLQDDWRTVLVGGLRAGGRGYFAIDVTDPDKLINTPVGSARETELAKNIMWEFTTDDDRDLGFTYSEPQIVPLGDGSSIEWYVVFGNGYNSLNGNTAYATAPVGPDDKPYVEGSNTHSSKLFILKLEGPTGNSGKTWVEGTDYWKIDSEYPTGASLTETVRNGLSTPAIADSDGNSIADLTYAGDLEGNLWAFDITGTVPGSWDIYKTATSTPKPLFIATDAPGLTGQRQPITAKPALLRNTQVTTVAGVNTPNLLVSFGTGSYITQTDLANEDPQSFYTVWDSGPDQAPLDNSDLTVQGITTETGPAPLSETFRVISPATLPVNYVIGGNSGWYHNLPATKERVINEAQIQSPALAYITIIPSTNPCSFGGTSWLMLVDAFTGTALSYSPYDVDNNGYIDSADVTSGGNIAAGTSTSSLAFNSTSVNAPNGAGVPGDIVCPAGTVKLVRFVTLSDGTVSSEEYCGIGKRGRSSWREINFTQ